MHVEEVSWTLMERSAQVELFPLPEHAVLGWEFNYIETDWPRSSLVCPEEKPDWLSTDCYVPAST